MHVPGQAKVAYLDFAGCPNEEILGFDIAVNDRRGLLVQI
jgi:hypothetical protein